MRSDAGSVALETALSLAVLVPLVFGTIELGDLYQRWLAQDAAAAAAARYAGELGGDDAAVRAFLAGMLERSGIDAASAIVRVEPPSVGWREPIRVEIATVKRLAIPFMPLASVTLRSSATARGEVAR
ncbi:MAG TPA: TadE/TadG family type IV pilus assembly protein [Candidatus Limnocylindria bacterium]|nr:TadE/TadG family type IV pilus assembly protein [Candidatus Limnocylindria bacterium]